MIERSAGMIARVADHCFWFGRYIERAESIARVLATTHNLAVDGDLGPEQAWQPVIIVAGEEHSFQARHGEDSAGNGELVQQFMTWDPDTMVSLRRTIMAARDNARSIREVLSLEVWEVTNELYLWMASADAVAQYRDHRYDFYRRIRQSTQLCLGLLRSTMLHETPLDFIWLGMLLERVSQTARFLDVHHHAFTTRPRHHEVIETALWLSLLRACSGFEPFMKRHQGRVSSSAVARFLICEPNFPRSIAYCVRAAYDRLCAIRPPAAEELPGGRSLARLRALHAWVADRSAQAIEDAAVHHLLTHVVDETHAVCNGIGNELFGYPVATAVPVMQ